MKILLTGASGFLGQTIKKVLSDHKIISLSRYNSDINVDLAIEVPVLPLSDLIVHAAGKAHSQPKTEIEKKEFFNVNVRGTANLLKAIENSKIPKAFVFISTVAVYGKESGNLINENEPLVAKDPYGLSKIMAEKLVTEWCEKQNVICTILRLPLIAGPNPPGNLGAMIQAISKDYYFNIAEGKAKKSIVLAKDIAKVILRVSEIGGIYNLTDCYHPSFKELSLQIANQLNKKPPLSLPNWLAKPMALIGDILGGKAPLNSNKLKKLTSDLTFDDSKASKVFGWIPTPVLEGFKIF